MENKVRVRFPLMPVVVAGATVIAGIATLAVTNSMTAYAVVMAFGAALALVLSVITGTAARRRVDEAAKPGYPRPWIEFEWPRWAKRAFRGYLLLVAAFVTIGVAVLLIAALVEALR